MRLVDRASVAEPPKLAAVRKAGHRHAAKFFRRPISERRQEHYFNAHWKRAYRIPLPNLRKLFHDKCAFCESKIENFESGGGVDHLRPKWGTRGLKGEYANDHYWWLAFTWPNLYLACAECDKYRGTRFPVEGPRMPVEGTDVTVEKPLVLDPCQDPPGEHLRFLESGIVQPLSRRAQITIDFFGLNRDRLVKSRRTLYKAQIEPDLKYYTGRDKRQKLKAFTRPEAPFSTFAQQCIQRVLPDLFSEVPAASGKHVVGSNVRTARKTAFLQSIRIENFRGVQTLQLEIPTADQPRMD